MQQNNNDEIKRTNKHDRVRRYYSMDITQRPSTSTDVLGRYYRAHNTPELNTSDRIRSGKIWSEVAVSIGPVAYNNKPNGLPHRAKM